MLPDWSRSSEGRVYRVLSGYLLLFLPCFHKCLCEKYTLISISISMTCSDSEYASQRFQLEVLRATVWQVIYKVFPSDCNPRVYASKLKSFLSFILISFLSLSSSPFLLFSFLPTLSSTFVSSTTCLPFYFFVFSLSLLYISHVYINKCTFRYFTVQ